MNTDKILNIIQENRNEVENNVHAKSIPTMLYDNQKHTGVFKNE